MNEEIKSNLNSYYEDLIESIAEYADENIKDGYAEDEYAAIFDAINDKIIYYCDQGYILAQAIVRGYAEWGKAIEWDQIYDMLYDDVKKDLEYKNNTEA